MGREGVTTKLEYEFCPIGVCHSSYQHFNGTPLTFKFAKQKKGAPMGFKPWSP
jgi:hypothetical protein